MIPPDSARTINNTAPEDDQFRFAYRSLISSSLTTSFPGFVRNLDSQQGVVAERGRAAVINFKEDGKTEVTEFKVVKHLREYLDQEGPSLSTTNATPRRCLYLLEDISRDYVEILGSRLRVPPAIFAAQLNDPSTSRGTYDDSGLVSFSPNYFRLRYRQLHQVKGSYPLGLYADSEGNVPRWLQLLDTTRQCQSSEHQFSFWATTYGRGSWTAVLLLDPIITQARLHPDATQARLYPRGFRLHISHPESGKDALPYPQPMSTVELPPNAAAWHAKAAVKRLSLFDGTLKHYQDSPHQVNEAPQSCTLASRRIVLYMWRGYLRSLDEEFHFLSDQMHYRQSPNDTPSGWYFTWHLSWRDEVFRKLSHGKTVVESANANLCIILETLGIGTGEDPVVSKYEASNWRSLQHAVKGLATKYEHLIAEYVQEGSIQESRGVGRLTKLATVLVPFSITAGIFSMGDDYLVGKSQFWVFWAVTIPLFLLVSIVVFTSLVPSLWGGAEKLVWKSQQRWPLLQKGSHRRSGA